jgi:tetratricopeptide (TPR) repeat protein
MADVTLRSTLKKIDALIDGGRYEEAKANTRHVLTHYPKNAQAYFALARVLVAQRQWDEAGEVLRRLLGARPLDVQAHLLLSAVYQNTDQPENALYHLERAFDQQPNDRQIINQLRELYGRYRNTAVEKVQLTAGAVAGQYLNNNLPDQAIDILTKALRRFPDRADLKLLLARAYRAAEQPVDAAEMATDALKALPYAVPANELMAEFWLEQGRPSDARAHITRIEEVDPYLALKVATGQDDEQRYTLPELDYRRVAERELSATNPDWLSSVQPGEADDLAWLTEDSAPPSPPRRKVTDNLPDLLADVPAPGGGSETIPVDENFTGEISPEVLRRLEALKGIANDGTIVTDARPADRPSDELSNFLDDIDAAPPQPPRKRTGLTGLLGALDAEAAKEPEMDEDSWLMEVINASDAQPPAGDVAPEDSGLMSLDFLSDLDPGAPISPQSGRISTGFTDRIESATPEPAEQFLDEPAHQFDDTAFQFEEFGFEEEPEGDTDALPEPRNSFFDSLEFVDDAAPAAPAQPRARGGDELPASDAADPLAWMRDTDIEYDEHAENPFEAMLSLDDADPISPQQVAQDPLAWARDTGGVEIDVEAVAAEEAQKPSTDPLAWMKGLDIELEQPAPEPGDQDQLKDLLQMEVLSTDELNSYIDPASQGDWQDAMTDNANWQDDDLEGFEWLSDDSTDLPESSLQAEDNPASDLDWMGKEDTSFDWEQESNPQAEAATGFTGMLDNLGAMYGSTDDDPLAWMNKYKTDYLDEASLGADPTAPVTHHAEAPPAEEQPGEVPDFFATTDDSLGFIEEAIATEGAEFAESYQMADDAGAFDFAAQSVDDDIPPPETLHEPPVGFTDFDEVLAGPPPSTADFDFDMSAEAATDDFGFGDESAEPAAELTDFNFDMSAEAATDDFGFGDESAEPAAELTDFNFDMSAEAATDDFGFGDESAEPAAELTDFNFDMSAEAATDDFGFGDESAEPAAELTDFDFDMSAEAAAELGDWMPDLGTAASTGDQSSLDDVDFGEYATSEENVSFGFDTAAFEAFEGDQEAVEVPPPAARRQPGDEFSFVDDLLEGEASEEEEFFLDEFALEQELAGEDVGQEFSMEQGSEEYSDEFNLDEFQLAEDDELVAADLSEFDFGEAQEPGAEPVADGGTDYSFEETGEPDWLGRIDGSGVSATATEEPDWLAAVGAPPVEDASNAYDEADAGDTYPEEPAAELADFDFDMSAEAATDDFDFGDASAEPAAELTDEPLASNIPDWLNTMAPGLDIDYENLPQNDVVEEAFEEGATYRERGALDEFTAVNDGYEWLTDIVEEESQNVAPVNPAAPPPPLAPLPEFSRANSEAPAPQPRSRSRFVFDKLPPWMLKLRGVTQRPPEPVAAPADDDEFADFDFDDDDLK